MAGYLLVANGRPYAAAVARRWRGHTWVERDGPCWSLVIGRADEHGPDPRFRLTPLAAGRYGLSLYRRQRWEPLPYEGTLQELVQAINEDLAAWAADWS